jgi:manganese/iron transport system permease protein
MMLAATTIAALQAVGMCLVVAVLVTPGATAYLITDRFGKMMWISLIIGVTSSVLGAYISYFLNGSTGGCIVVLQASVFVIALFFAPKHGIIAGRQKARAAAMESAQRSAATDGEGTRVS